jgi:hypothetical protein
LIKDIPEVFASDKWKDCHVLYVKSPFSMTANLPDTGLIACNNPKLISSIYTTKFATTARTNVLDITSATGYKFWNNEQVKQVVGKSKRRVKYSRLPFGFHGHLKITTTDGRTRDTCIHQSYFEELPFLPLNIFKHTHLPYRTNEGEIGMTCFHSKHIHPKGTNYVSFPSIYMLDNMVVGE